MTNSGPQLWVNGALEMPPNISYQPLSTARFASLTLPLYMNGNSFKLVKSPPSTNHQLAIVADNLYHEVHEVGISVLERT